jgi:hypothetical protein
MFGLYDSCRLARNGGRRMHSHMTTRAGGLALIGGAVAFLGVFSFLAARFDYPEVLDGSAAEVLPKLLATGTAGRAVWALYGFLPLIWIPAGAGAFHALRPVREGSARTAMLFAVVAAISMMLGLLRWPSIHWALAEAYAAGGPSDRAVIAAVFTGLNSYLGNYVGEFLGELCFSVFFLLSALAMLAPAAGFPRWMGYFGVVTAVAGLLGMFRNVTDVVDPVAAANNYLLPLWMIVFGIGLLRYDRAASKTADPKTNLWWPSARSGRDRRSAGDESGARVEGEQ